jgi:hypothetical protein
MFEREYNKKKEEYEWNFSSYLKAKRVGWKESTRLNVLFLSIAYQLNSQQEGF